MSKQVLISLLAQGNNGNEILQILDTLVADTVSDNEEVDIEFWLIPTVCPLVDAGGHLCYTHKYMRNGSMFMR